MMKKILIIANNSGGLYRFRKDLIQNFIQQGMSVIAITPFDDKVNELKQLGIQLIEINIDRRGINPVKDLRLIFNYYKIIKNLDCNMVITYTIKPNVYGGIICSLLH